MAYFPAAAGPLVAVAASTERSSQQHWSPFICLAHAIYFEARSETVAGQRAVGQVILNRVESRTYPNTVCGVVYQNAHRKNRCQFSFACDGKRERIRELQAYETAMTVARDLLACDSECRKWSRLTGGAAISTHYHANEVSPSWSRVFRRTAIIGRHKFYVAVKK